MNNDTWGNWIVLIIFLLLLAVLAGCSKPLRNPEVIAKLHEERVVETQLFHYRSGNGTAAVTPQKKVVPEKWTLVIRGYNDEDEPVHLFIEVDEDTYDRFEHGDPYPAAQ